MKLTTSVIMVAVAWAGLAASAPAGAVVIRWKLSNDVVFSDGGTAFGTFSFDTVSESVTALNITTTAGTSQSGAVYKPANAYIGSNATGFTANRDDSFLEFVFSDLLSGTSSSNALVPGADGENSFEVTLGDSAVRYVTSGSVASFVPEPATWELMVAGFGMAGLGIRRRTTATV